MFAAQLGVVQENRHRIMDLRAGACSEVAAPLPPPDAASAEWHLKLMVGSQIAAEARAALKASARPFLPPFLNSSRHNLAPNLCLAVRSQACNDQVRLQ